MPDDAWWDSPAFDAAVRAAERRGRVTYRELNAVLPIREATSKEIEALLADLRRRGIEIEDDDRP